MKAYQPWWQWIPVIGGSVIVSILCTFGPTWLTYVLVLVAPLASCCLYQAMVRWLRRPNATIRKKDLAPIAFVAFIYTGLIVLATSLVSLVIPTHTPVMPRIISWLFLWTYFACLENRKAAWING